MMGHSDQGMDVGRERYQAIPRVLVFLRNGPDVLLLKGAATKRIWANQYNGVGGHVEAGEDVITAARRETYEETGLTVSELKLTAVAHIDAGDLTRGILMFVFTGWTAERQTVPSPEGSLHWIAVDKISEVTLVEDLNWLLPNVMALKEGENPLFLHYFYDEQEKLVITKAD